MGWFWVGNGRLLSLIGFMLCLWFFFFSSSALFLSDDSELCSRNTASNDCFASWTKYMYVLAHALSTRKSHA